MTDKELLKTAAEIEANLSKECKAALDAVANYDPTIGVFPPTRKTVH